MYGSDVTPDGPSELRETDGYQPDAPTGNSPTGALVQLQLARRLRESERRYHDLIQALPAAVYTTDADGRITMYNSAAVDLWGREPELGQDRWCGSYRMYLPDGRDLPLDCCPMAVAIQQRKRLNGIEAVVERPDGERRNVLAYPHLVYDSSGAVIGATNVLLDITERKQAEIRLREAQKLESVGLLAGGIAHDFNNLLVGVLGNASLAAELAPPGSRLLPLLDEIQVASQRAAHLTRQMLAYAGKAQFVVENIDLSKLTRETLTLVQASISKKIVFDLRLASDLPHICADPGEAQQVVMNLILNAAEAIGDALGSISIRTTGETVGEGGPINDLDGKPVLPGVYVCLEVRDTGCGMDGETRSRIFDPFFSTKFAGRGLGLAAVAGILRGHNGVARVTSLEGRGTTFQVMFPAACEPARAFSGAVPE